MKEKIALGILMFLLISLAVVGAQSPDPNAERTTAERVGRLDSTVCCEKTKSGLYCQDVKEEECADGARKLPTACSSSSYCKPGFCSDPVEGICLDNTPQKVCNDNKGNWFAEKPSQCNLGCCIIGDQASFVTLTRCKRLSSVYAQETNFNTGISSEEVCILTAGAKEKGACVYEDAAEFGKKCKITTREECTSEKISAEENNQNSNAQNPSESNFVRANNAQTRSNTEATNVQTNSETTNAQSNQGENIEQTNQGTQNQQTTGGTTGAAIAETENGSRGNRERAGGIEFHPGKLCSAEELGTTCGPSKETTCLPGKEEVYFLDTCGNPANIYDSSKLKDSDYWSNIKDKTETCGANSGNENSQTCGNCNYLMGSYCRESGTGMAKAIYGENVCASLNCKDNKGKVWQHGESWCGYDGGNEGKVGSKAYRYVCQNGQITIEPCADFRQEECVENSRGGFSEAGCRVNRWQDCTAQKEKRNCENKDKRDCKWLGGKEYILLGSLVSGNGTTGATGGINSMDALAAAIKQGGGLKNLPLGTCVPEIPPGLKHWEGGEAGTICAQANAICPVTYEKGLTGGGWKCVKNCECLPGGQLEQKRKQLCTALADCGQKVNFVGQRGAGEGTRTTQQKMSSDKK